VPTLCRAGATVLSVSTVDSAFARSQTRALGIGGSKH